MKKNLNPLYEFINPFHDYYPDMVDNLNKNPIDINELPFKKGTFDQRGMALQDTLKSSSTGMRVGAGIGTLGGGYLGNKLVGAITGKKGRNTIKAIIINSDTPQQCINSLKQLGTGKSNDYINKVIELQKDPQWKTKLLKSINIKNALSTGIGSVTGGYIGNAVGGVLGGGIGIARGGIKHKDLL